MTRQRRPDPATVYYLTAEASRELRNARRLLRMAGSRRAADAVAKALNSVLGALRHARNVHDRNDRRKEG